MEFVFTVSKTIHNQYHVDEKRFILNSGLFCHPSYCDDNTIPMFIPKRNTTVKYKKNTLSTLLGKNTRHQHKHLN
jgi:hypothetical protein